MNITHDLKMRLRVWLSDESPPRSDRTVTPLRRRLSGDDVADLVASGASRDDPIWHEIEQLLVQLRQRYPSRTARIRRDLKWLRKQAHKNGRFWGKPR